MREGREHLIESYVDELVNLLNPLFTLTFWDVVCGGFVTNITLIDDDLNEGFDDRLEVGQPVLR